MAGLEDIASKQSNSINQKQNPFSVTQIQSALCLESAATVTALTFPSAPRRETVWSLLRLRRATTLLLWMHQLPRTAESANAAPPALASTANVDIKSPIRPPMVAI